MISKQKQTAVSHRGAPAIRFSKKALCHWRSAKRHTQLYINSACSISRCSYNRGLLLDSTSVGFVFSMSEVLAYNTNLRAPIEECIGETPKARVHRVEWRKVMDGDPVEINPSVGQGYRVMTVDEWANRWKPNTDFQDCLHCSGKNTKEHHFMQTWCRGKKKWESEALCLDCHHFSWRAYCDPDFLTPEEYEKKRWQNLVASQGVAIGVD